MLEYNHKHFAEKVVKNHVQVHWLISDTDLNSSFIKNILSHKSQMCILFSKQHSSKLRSIFPIETIKKPKVVGQN